MADSGARDKLAQQAHRSAERRAATQSSVSILLIALAIFLGTLAACHLNIHAL